MALAKIVVILVVISVVNSATWRFGNPSIPSEFAGQEGCYIKEVNKVIPFGSEIKPEGQCRVIYCGEQYSHGASCIKVSAGDDNCYVTDYDMKRPYPDCCPTVKCEKTNYISVD